MIDLPKGGYVPAFGEAEPPSVAPRNGSSRAGSRPPWPASHWRPALGAWWILHRDAAIPIAVLPLVESEPGPGDRLLCRRPD